MASSKPSAPFGQERTAQQHRDRAEWEREQAARLRAEARGRPASELPVGHEHVAQAHEDTARAYDRRAKELDEAMVSTAQRGEARGKSRAELVGVARAAAASVFAPRKDGSVRGGDQEGAEQGVRRDPPRGPPRRHQRSSRRGLLARHRGAGGGRNRGGTAALGDDSRVDA